MNAPPQIIELVDRFSRNLEAYRSGQYNETQVRREFIDPLFGCLGWDIDNRQGFAEAYKDVIHEDAIKIGGETKAPDYSFRIGGARKFFLEAKRPSVNLKTDPEPAFQLRRYAWSARLPLSILTDFEEFAVYDCRVKPAKTDKAATARIRYLTFADYAEQWDSIADVFSKEAVLKGSFDKFAAASRLKKGTATVDAAFLKEIEDWRESLARNIALRNSLTQRELNYAVQVTIDRILFLRMCEDRGVEFYGQLAALRNGSEVYARLNELFRKADQRYNSGLFHFEQEKDRPEPPDELTASLSIDDKPLKDIFKGLYYPESPYEFSVLPAQILGQVYEQFLGKLIRLSGSHRAIVEEKPEVRKAGGVYYTPTYIVDYIVKNTVGKLLDGKTPRQAAKLKTLDPACGSGSFLLGAYQYLLDWHRDRYLADGADKHRKELFQGRGDLWYLTSAEKKRILLNNVYGVDIDAQAVEVTKLSLLLKVLEGESQETLEVQRRLYHERALPDLAENIRCGNSLIGPDFYEGQQKSLLDEEERYRVNVFDWDAAFPAIMTSGGFDAVIGNPPWGQKAIDDATDVKEYVQGHYPSSAGIYDLFRPFVERGIRLVCDGGAFAMVLPDIVLLKDYESTRRYMLEHLALERIDWWGMAFASAIIDAATIVGTRSSAAPDQGVVASVRDEGTSFSQTILQRDFWLNPRLTFNLFLTPEKRAILDQLQKNAALGDLFEVHEGVHSGNIRSELFVDEKLDESCRELYFGRGEIERHRLHWEGKYIRLGAMPNGKTRQRYANIGKPEWHEREKVLVRRTGDYVLAGVDTVGRYASNNFFVVFPKTDGTLDLDGLCGLLNSRFMTWYFRTIEPRRGRVFAELKIKHLVTFPLPSNKAACCELNKAGSERRKLAEQLANARIATDRTLLITAGVVLDARIDDLTRTAYSLASDIFNNLIMESE